MTYRQIEQARETRLWLTHVVAPTALVVLTVVSNEKVMNAIVDSVHSVKERIATKFKKEKGS